MKHIETKSEAFVRGESRLTKSGSLQAVVLAGGLGTRLRPYTLLLPKPMLPVGPKPILEHIIEWLKSGGVGEVVVSTGYLGRMIEGYFRNGSEVGIRIRYARSNRPMGIAGQLKAAENMLNGRFLCLYGDAILKFDISGLVEFHRSRDSTVTMVLMPYETSLKYGLIDVDAKGRVKAWREKPTLGGHINVGCYMMEKKFLKYIPSGKIYGMREAFERAKKAGEPVYGYKAKGEFIDIGDKQSYREANERFVKTLGEL